MATEESRERECGSKQAWCKVGARRVYSNVTNCSFGNPRVVGSSLGHTMNRVVWEAQLYSGEYRRIIAVRVLYRMIQE